MSERKEKREDYCKFDQKINSKVKAEKQIDKEEKKCPRERNKELREK